MIFHILYLLVLLCVVKSDDDFHESIWRDMNNNTIDVNKYCADKNCVVKCCPMEKLVVGNRCMRPKKKAIARLLNYSDIDVYNWDSASSKLINTKKKFYSHFVFINNNDFFNLKMSLPYPYNATLLENGAVHHSDGSSLNKLEYCVDFKLLRGNHSERFNFTARSILIDNTRVINIKYYYVATGMLISSFLMLLVLLVYSVLRSLRGNIIGKILMAYLISLTCAYVLKATQLICVRSKFADDDVCQSLSPVLYYFSMASFFWLNVMSFDLFRNYSGPPKPRRNIYDKEELHKFYWYCVYAWGVSMVMALIIIYFHRFNVAKIRDYVSSFDDSSTDLYLSPIYWHVPIGIITISNIIMFMLTAYNIWLVKRGVRNTEDNRTINSVNRFRTYISLFVCMGCGWILELIPDLPLVPYIIVNFFNVFIGVTIFINFVCKRSIIKKLCKRFHIKNSYEDKLMSSRSKSTKSSQLSRTYSSNIASGDAKELSLNAPDP